MILKEKQGPLPNLWIEVKDRYFVFHYKLEYQLETELIQRHGTNSSLGTLSFPIEVLVSSYVYVWRLLLV